MAIKGEYEYLEIRDRCRFQLVKYLEKKRDQQVKLAT